MDAATTRALGQAAAIAGAIDRATCLAGYGNLAASSPSNSTTTTSAIVVVIVVLGFLLDFFSDLAAPATPLQHLRHDRCSSQ
jgi:hypothetical protein